MDHTDRERKLYDCILQHISLLFADENFSYSGSADTEGKQLFLVDCLFIQYHLRVPYKTVEAILSRYAFFLGEDYSVSDLIEQYHQAEEILTKSLYSQPRSTRFDLIDNLHWLSDVSDYLHLSVSSRLVLKHHLEMLLSACSDHSSHSMRWFHAYSKIIVPLLSGISLYLTVFAISAQDMNFIIYALYTAAGIFTAYGLLQKRNMFAFHLQQIYSGLNFCIWGGVCGSLISQLFHNSIVPVIVSYALWFGAITLPNLIYFEKRRSYFDEASPQKASYGKPILFRIILSAVFLTVYWLFLLIQVNVSFQNERAYQQGYQDASSDYQQLIKNKEEEIAQLKTRPTYSEGYEAGVIIGRNVGNAEGKIYQYTIPNLHLLSAYFDTRDGETVLAFDLQNTTSSICYGWEMEIEFFKNSSSQGIYTWSIDNRTILPGQVYTGYLTDGEENFLSTSNKFTVHSITWIP